MADDPIFSDTLRKVLWGLHRLHITDFLMRCALPIYGKVNKYNPKEFRFFSVGQSHLDSAWCWRWIPDTAPYKLSHTMGYNLNNLKLFPQRNLRNGYQDGYKFSFPAPAHYEYMEQHWPRSFKELQKQVKKGRWELVGGMYVESDCNVPDGESFVRQRLYGQKYFLEKFGKIAVIEWLPDSFGFCWTLPQILLKSGAKGYYTTKLTWMKKSRPGEGARFPFGWFYWQGPDGSRILSYNFNQGWRSLEKVGLNKHDCRLMKTGENPLFSYSDDVEASGRFSHEYIPEFLWMYGQGDGGHGPVQLEIMVADACERAGIFQQVKAGVIFKLIQQKYASRLPVWNDELYLPLHRGVQTTLHTLKQENRNGEVRLQTLEKMACLVNPQILTLLKEDLDLAWKKVLFNQFHDILPGSSIHEVYQDADKDYNDIIYPILNKIQSEIQRNISLQSGASVNPKDIVAFFPHHWNQPYKISLNAVNSSKSTPNLCYFSPSSGVGIEIIHEAILSKPNPVQFQDQSLKLEIKTPFYTVIIDKPTGSISSFKLQASGKEFAQNHLNILRLFKDNPEPNDAWEIDDYYRENPCDAPQFDSPQIVPGNQHLLIRFPFKTGEKSQGTLDYLCSNAVPFIECNMEIDWQEAHKLLRVEYDTTLHAQKYITGLPFGWIERSTDPQTPMDKSRWEAPGQLFAELPDPSRNCGLAIFVYDRYGFHATPSQLGLSLLRAPSYGPPDKNACAWYDPSTESSRVKIKDLGQHTQRWAIYPHEGTFQTAEVIPKATGFSYSPIIYPINNVSTQGTLKNTIPSIQIDTPKIQISALKPTYNNSPSGLILRCVELYGEKVNVTMESSLFEQRNVVECDLLEDVIANQTGIILNGKKLTFQTKPFEIKSFLIR